MMNEAVFLNIKPPEGATEMGEIQEVTAAALDPKQFIETQVGAIATAVGDAKAITALSGGVDSSTVTVLGHRALGDRLQVVFINNGLMREAEPESVVEIFAKLGIDVKVIDAQDQFFGALQFVIDPEEKRQAITDTFYRDVFGPLAQEDNDTKYLLQGTILTDVEETVAGTKRQHNVLAQMGIDTEKEYGYTVIEPLIQLRKDGVRLIAKALGFDKAVYDRMPFPGPALAARVVGEVTPSEIAIVRKATRIVEDELYLVAKFQCLAILHADRVTGIHDGKREFGRQIEVRCWDSIDARTATPVRLTENTCYKIARAITEAIPEVVSVTYSITTKPPSTIEAI